MAKRAPFVELTAATLKLRATEWIKGQSGRLLKEIQGVAEFRLVIVNFQ
jgi:hypothetical protein